MPRLKVQFSVKATPSQSLTKTICALSMIALFSVPAVISETTKIKELEPGVYDVPLKLTAALEPRRKEFHDDLIEAQKNLKIFATNNNWQKLLDPSFMKEARIFDEKSDYDNMVYESSPEIKGTPIPKTFTAALEKHIFFAMKPEYVSDVYPEGVETGYYTKLMTHELAHRLHARIVGDEKKMGPMWFWEGFAVYAADQFVANTPELSKDQIWEIVNAKERGSYRKYKAVFVHFLPKATSLADFVKRAGDPHFVDWLKKVDEHK
jgi:hypothetical protein